VGSVQWAVGREAFLTIFSAAFARPGTCQLLQYSPDDVRSIISSDFYTYAGTFSALKPHERRASYYREWLFRQTMQSLHGAKPKVSIWFHALPAFHPQAFPSVE
jgi:hypothetical protein